MVEISLKELYSAGSGLGMQQYKEASMSARFEIVFNRINCVEENHITPCSTVRNFLFCSLLYGRLQL